MRQQPGRIAVAFTAMRLVAVETETVIQAFRLLAGLLDEFPA